MGRRLCLHAGGGMPHVMFTTTGSQATALAVRMARKVTKRQRLLVFSGSWHGWAAEFEGGQEPSPPDSGYRRDMGV